MKAQTRLSRHPRSWRSRAVAFGLTAWALAWTTSGLQADNNQTGFADSDPFPLDTGEDGGTIQSGVGTSPSPGFSLDTRDDPSSFDFSQSGMADSHPFDLDTGGPASGHESNQSGFADSGAFELDTQDSSPSGLADSEGFTLDTRDSGGNSNQAEFGFDDSNGFPLDTGGSSGSNPNDPPAFQSDGNLSVPENQTFVFDFNASDPDGDALSYSLLYGDDHHLFDLNASTGILTFLTPKDFEAPEDNDSDNRYEATVQVSDG
ncbi:MAG: cadherin repeat domain-containing protein, partial [Opitutae bacterium]|nr:cadherin repeat domain-containing protein [Opitutae bacterium]